MKKKDIIEEDLGRNPFVVPLSIPIRRISKKEYDENGVPKFGAYDLELTESTRFYISNTVRDLLCKMPGSSAQLLLWIMQKLENGNDYVHIKRSTCMKELGMTSPNTYKSAIKALCDRSFIAAIYLMPDVYFINPQIFFNGNRSKKFPNNIEEYVPKNKPSENEN